MGANAIIGFYTSRQARSGIMESGIWGSGLAVKWYQTNDSVISPRPYFIAAIKPWVPKSGDPKNGLMYLGTIAHTAQYFLGKSGYYSFISELPYGNVIFHQPAGLATLDSGITSGRNSPAPKIDPPLENSFGYCTEYIMYFKDIPVAKTDSTYYDMTAVSAIWAGLYSKSAKRLIWENRLNFPFNYQERLFDGGRSRGDYNFIMNDYYTILRNLFDGIPTAASPPHIPDYNDYYDEAFSLWQTDNPLAVSSGKEVEFDIDTKEMARLAPHMLLYDAVARDDTLGARQALELGADINFLGYNENTPLHTAAIKAGPAMVNFLLQNGARQDMHNESGLTPLEITEGKGNFTPRPDIAAILREFGKK